MVSVALAPGPSLRELRHTVFWNSAGDPRRVRHGGHHRRSRLVFVQSGQYPVRLPGNSAVLGGEQHHYSRIGNAYIAVLGILECRQVVGGIRSGLAAPSLRASPQQAGGLWNDRSNCSKFRSYFRIRSVFTGDSSSILCQVLAPSRVTKSSSFAPPPTSQPNCGVTITIGPATESARCDPAVSTPSFCRRLRSPALRRGPEILAVSPASRASQPWLGSAKASRPSAVEKRAREPSQAFSGAPPSKWLRRCPWRPGRTATRQGHPVLRARIVPSPGWCRERKSQRSSRPLDRAE